MDVRSVFSIESFFMTSLSPPLMTSKVLLITSVDSVMTTSTAKLKRFIKLAPGGHNEKWQFTFKVLAIK